MACGNLFNRCGRRGMYGYGRRNNYNYNYDYPVSVLGAYGNNGNGWNNGCGCRKAGTFVDYMPVVVDYTVTPMNYNVIGIPEPGYPGYRGLGNAATPAEVAVAADILDDGVINGSNRRPGKCGCGR